LREFPQQKIPSELCGEVDPQQKIPRELCGEVDPQQKIPRELCGDGDPAIFLHSSAPMERVFDGTDQENSKTQEGKNGGNKKKRFFIHLSGGSHTRVFSIGREHPWATTLSCDPRSREPTHMRTLPYNKNFWSKDQ